MELCLQGSQINLATRDTNTTKSNFFSNQISDISIPSKYYRRPNSAQVQLINKYHSPKNRPQSADSRYKNFNVNKLKSHSVVDKSTKSNWMTENGTTTNSGSTLKTTSNEEPVDSCKLNFSAWDDEHQKDKTDEISKVADLPGRVSFSNSCDVLCVGDLSDESNGEEVHQSSQRPSSRKTVHFQSNPVFVDTSKCDHETTPPEKKCQSEKYTSFEIPITIESGSATTAPQKDSAWNNNKISSKQLKKKNGEIIKNNFTKKISKKIENNNSKKTLKSTSTINVSAPQSQRHTKPQNYTEKVLIKKSRSISCLGDGSTNMNEFQIDKIESWMSMYDCDDIDKVEGDRLKHKLDSNLSPSSPSSISSSSMVESTTTYDEIVDIIKEIDGGNKDGITSGHCETQTRDQSVEQKLWAILNATDSDDSGNTSGHIEMDSKRDSDKMNWQSKLNDMSYIKKQKKARELVNSQRFGRRSILQNVFVFDEESENILGLDGNLYDSVKFIRFEEESIKGKNISVNFPLNGAFKYEEALSFILRDLLQFNIIPFQINDRFIFIEKMEKGEIDFIAADFPKSNFSILAPTAAANHEMYMRQPIKEFSSSFFINVFERHVWYAVIGIILASCLVFGLYKLLNNKFKFNLIEAIYCTLGLASLSGSGHMCFSLRVTFFVLSMFMFVIMGAFSTFLITELSVSEIILPFQNLDEIRHQNEYRLCTPNGSTTNTIELERGYNLQQGNCPKEHLFSYNYMKSICNIEKTVYISKPGFVYSEIIQNYNGRAPCDIYVFKNPYGAENRFLQLTSRRHFKYKRQIRRSITQLRTSGILVYLYRKFFGINRIQMTSNEIDDLVPVQYEHVRLIFQVYLCFMAISGAILIIEIIRNKYRNQARFFLPNH